MWWVDAGPRARMAYLSSVNKNPSISSPYQIGICPLKLHVSRVAAQKSHNAGRYILSIRQFRQPGSLSGEVFRPEARRVKPFGLGA